MNLLPVAVVAAAVLCSISTVAAAFDDQAPTYTINVGADLIDRYASTWGASYASSLQMGFTVTGNGEYLVVGSRPNDQYGAMAIYTWNNETGTYSDLAQGRSATQKYGYKVSAFQDGSDRFLTGRDGSSDYFDTINDDGNWSSTLDEISIGTGTTACPAESNYPCDVLAAGPSSKYIMKGCPGASYAGRYGMVYIFRQQDSNPDSYASLAFYYKNSLVQSDSLRNSRDYSNYRGVSVSWSWSLVEPENTDRAIFASGAPGETSQSNDQFVSNYDFGGNNNDWRYGGYVAMNWVYGGVAMATQYIWPPIATSGVATGNKFGSAVRLTPDGRTMIVSAPGHRDSYAGLRVGAFYRYENDGTDTFVYKSGPHTGPGEVVRFGWHIAINDDASRVWVTAPDADKVYQYHWDYTTDEYILDGAFTDNNTDSGFAHGTSLYFDQTHEQLYVGAYKNTSQGSYTEVGAVHVFDIPATASMAPTQRPTSGPTTLSPTLSPTAPTTPVPTTAESVCRAEIYSNGYLNQERNTFLVFGTDVSYYGVLGLGRDVGTMVHIPPTKYTGVEQPGHVGSFQRTANQLVCVSDDSDNSLHCTGSGLTQILDEADYETYYEFNRVSAVEEDTSITQIDKVVAGMQNLCLVVNDFTAVKCMGFNGYGTLGDGSTTSIKTGPLATPIDVSGESDSKIRYLETMGDTYCAIFENHTMACWGNGKGWRLGAELAGSNVANVKYLSPVFVELNVPGVGILRSATRYDSRHVVLGTDGNLYMTGLNQDEGVVTTGDGKYGYLRDWTQLDTGAPNDMVNAWWVGESTLCAQYSNMSVSCAGSGSYNLFGDTTIHHYGEFARAPKLDYARDIAHDGRYAFTVMYQNGTVARFGYNYDLSVGEVSDVGNVVTTPLFIEQAYCYPLNDPQTLAPTGAPTTSPTINPTHCVSTLSATENIITRLDTRLNQLWVAGMDNGNGRVGEAYGYYAPYDLMALDRYQFKQPSQIECSGYVCCVVDAYDDSLWCWGSKDQGLVGDKSYSATESVKYPVKSKLLAPGKGIKQIILTEKVNFILLNDNRTLMGWGGSSYNMIGYSSSWYSLVTIKGITKDIDTITSGRYCLIIRYQDGSYGFLGSTSGFSGYSYNSGVATVADAPNWEGADNVHMANNAGCLVGTNGKAYTGGNTNSYGQTNPYNVGTSPGTSIIEIAELGSDNAFCRHYYNFVCFVKKTSGDVYCFGQNSNGQLDPNQSTSAYLTTPVQITNLTGVTQLSGYMEPVAMTRDGEIKLFAKSSYAFSKLVPSSSYNTPAEEVINLHDYSCPADGPATYCGEGDHSVCKATGYSATFCNMAYGTSSANGLCTKPVECSTHYDCAPYMYTGRLPFCSSAGICLDKYAGSCTGVKNCNVKVDRLGVFSSSVATMSQKLSSGGNSTRMKQAAQSIMDQLATSVNASDTGVDIEVMIDSTETVTLDMGLVNLLGGNKTALLAALQTLACSEDYSDFCSSAWSSSSRRLLLEARELASEGLIEVSVSYSIDPDTYAALIAGGMSFSDGSSFEEALAAALNVTTDDIEVYASDGTIEIAYVVTSEADTEGSPDMTEKIAAIQSVNSNLATITSAVTTSLGIDASDIETAEVDLCENRDCNDRGTCNSETGVCTCTTAGYWGVNCETSVSCENGGTVPFDGTAYCQCSWPYKGLRCGESVSSEECGATCSN